MDRIKIIVPREVFGELKNNYSGQDIGEHKKVHAVKYNSKYYVCTGMNMRMQSGDVWGGEAIPLKMWKDTREPVEYPGKLKEYSYYGIKIETQFGTLVMLDEAEFHEFISQPSLF